MYTQFMIITGGNEQAGPSSYAQNMIIGIYLIYEMDMHGRCPTHVLLPRVRSSLVDVRVATDIAFGRRGIPTLRARSALLDVLVATDARPSATEGRRTES